MATSTKNLPTARAGNKGLLLNDMPTDILFNILSLARSWEKGHTIEERRFYRPPKGALKAVCRDWFTMLEHSSSLYTTLLVCAEYQAGGVITNLAEVEGVWMRSQQTLLDVIISPSYDIDDMEERGDDEGFDESEDTEDYGGEPSGNNEIQAAPPFDMQWLFGLGLAARCKSLTFTIALYYRHNFFSSLVMDANNPFPYLEEAHVHGLNDLHPPIEGVIQAPGLRRLYTSGWMGVFSAGKPMIAEVKWGNLQAIHFLNSPYRASDMHALLGLATSLVDLRIKCLDKEAEPPLVLFNNTLQTLHIDYDYRRVETERMFEVFELYTFSSLSSLSIHTKLGKCAIQSAGSPPSVQHIPCIVANHSFVDSLAFSGVTIAINALARALELNPTLQTLSLGSFGGKYESWSPLCSWDAALTVAALSQSLCPDLKRIVLTNAEVSITTLRGFLERVHSVRIVELRYWWCKDEDWPVRGNIEEGGRSLFTTRSPYSGRRWRGRDTV